jgi:hypothetical protein
MKKLLSVLVLVIIAGTKLSAQFSINVPTLVCLDLNTTGSTYVNVSTAQSGATSYSWTIAGPTSCSSPSIGITNSTLAIASAYCAGNYTVSCAAYSGSSLLATTSSTFNAIPGAGFSVTASQSGTICSGTQVTLTAVNNTLNTYTWMPGNLAGNSVVLTPAAGITNYTAYSNNGQGCSSFFVGAINVVSTPTVSIIGNNTVCPMGYAMLTPSGASNYTWNPAPSYQYNGTDYFYQTTASACYTLTGSVGSCTASAVHCVTVVGGMPSVSGTSVCPGANATLQVSGLNSYTLSWYTQAANSYTSVTSGSAVYQTSVAPTPTYYVSGINSAGCYVNYVGTISFLPAQTITITATPQNTICSGQSVTLTASGATGYQWFPGNSTSASIVVTPTNGSTYNVVGTQTSSCSSFTTIYVQVLNGIGLMSMTGTNVCSGQTSTLYAYGGSFNYTWTAPSGTITNSNPAYVSPSSNTCYTVVAVHPTAGCTYSGSICLNVSNNTLTVTGPATVCPNSQAVFCATVASGGGYSYSWSNGGWTSCTTETTALSGAGCLTVTAYSSSGCMLTGSVCYTIVPPPTVTITGNTGICVGSTATLTASGASSYSWIIPGSTGIQSGSTATYNTIYTYFNPYLFVSHAGGCVTTETFTIGYAATPTVSVASSQYICAGGSATLSASGGLTYTWQPGNLVGQTVVVSPTNSATYYVYAGQSSGCPGFGSTSVNFPPDIYGYASNSVICPGQSVTLNTYSTTGFTNFSWYDGNNVVATTATCVATPTANTCYTLSATHIGSGCTRTAVVCVNISSPSAQIIGSSTTCAGGYVYLYTNYVAGQSYTWMPGNTHSYDNYVYPTSNTCYTLTVRNNAGGCSSTSVHCISMVAPPAITVTGNQAICSGASLTLMAQGGWSYSWTPPSITGTVITITPATSNVMTVTGVSGTGCNMTQTVAIVVNATPTLSLLGPNNICPGSSAALYATGAANFTWLPSNTNGNTLTVMPTAPTVYTLLGTNPGGCSSVTTKTVNLYSLPAVNISASSTVCAGSPLTLLANGASTYVWNILGSGASQVVNPSSDSCYYVTGTSPVGCTATAVHCVTVLPLPSIGSLASATVCEGSSHTFTASGAASYLWSNAATSNTINVMPSATTAYTVTGTGSNGCFATSVVSLVVDTTCTDVWPGDANSDGMVNTSDVLEIGLAYSATGSARTPGGNSYVAQFASNWSGTVSSGKNKCHADCNGDGTVDNADTLAIFNNFGLSHAFRSSSNGTDIRVVSDQTYFTAGTWNKVDIYAGDGQTNIQLYGLTFDIDFDNTLVQSGAAYLIYTSSFLNNNNQNVEFKKPDFSSGKVYAASVRTDHNNVSGTGKIGELHFLIKQGTEGQFMSLGASNSERVDKDGNHSDQAGNNILVEIRADDVGLSRQTKDIVFSIIPNPATDRITLRNTSSKTTSYNITDVSGRTLQNGEFAGAATIDTSQLPAGVYMITCKSADLNSTQRLVIQR